MRGHGRGRTFRWMAPWTAPRAVICGLAMGIQLALLFGGGPLQRSAVAQPLGIATNVYQVTAAVPNDEAPNDEAQVVATVTRALLHQDWTTLYRYSSSVTFGNLSTAQFASLMATQMRDVGRFTALRLVAPPRVGYDAGGDTIFTVQQAATVDYQGTRESRQLVSTYVLERGAWRVLQWTIQ